MFDFMSMLQQSSPMQGLMGALGNPQGYALDQAKIPGDDEWNKALQSSTQQALASVIPPGATPDMAQRAMDLPGGSVSGGTMTQRGADQRSKFGSGLMGMGQMMSKPQSGFVGAQPPMQMPPMAIPQMPQMQMPQMQQRGAIPMPYSPYAKPLIRR
jgi:hypothetical protein